MILAECRRVLFPFMFLLVHVAAAQITCENAVGRDTTMYSNGLTNDSLFFLCSGDSVKLSYSAMPNSVLEWYRYSSPSNSWINLSHTASSYHTMQSGGYRVVERDLAGIFIRESVVWTSRLPAPNPINPTLYLDVNLNTLAPGCGSVSLNWISVFFGLNNIVPYYNKPKPQITSSLPFDMHSSIEVCLSVYHAYMNDLQLYLIGPESCGRPVITLAEGITSNDSICPQVFGDPLTLCFTNGEGSNFNYCLFNASAPSTYNSYGWNNTPIVWDSLYGCDMNENDWHVQVSDCIGEFVGLVSQANISVSGVVDGVESYADYVLSSPSDVIINNCESDTSMLPLFNRSFPSAVARGYDARLQLSSNPPIPGLSDLSPSIEANGGSYTIQASDLAQNTVFYAEIIRPRIDANACGQPVQTTDSSYYDYIEPDTADISGYLNEYCVNGVSDTLESGSGNGFWTGPGMDADSSSGIFSPSIAGVGNHTIIFRRYTGCKTGDTVVIAVDTFNLINITAPQIVCDSLNLLSLYASIGGPNADPSLGVWAGNAIISDSLGWADPGAMSPGANEYIFSYNDGCVQQASLFVNAEHYIPLELNVPDSTFCSSEPAIQYSSNVPGVWSGPGITSEGTFNPAQSQAGDMAVIFNPQSICYSNIIVPVQVVNPLPLSLTLDNSICDTLDAIEITANYPNGNWQGANSTSPLSAVFTVTETMSGPYHVSYIIDGVCVDSIQSTIEVEDFQPLVSTMNDTVLCVLSDSILLSSNFEGSWSGLSNSGNVLIPTNQGAGVHLVTFQPLSSCHLPVSYSIDIRQPVPINLLYDSQICDNQDSLFFSAEPENGNWISDLNLIQTAQGQVGVDITQEFSGNYTLYYVLPDVCDSRDTAGVYIEDYSPLYMPFQDTTLCNNSDTIIFESNYAGIWSGPGIIESNGLFYAAAAPLTQFEISFTPASVCHANTFSSITLLDPPNLEISIQPWICSNADSIYPTANIPGGQWSINYSDNLTDGAIFPPEVPTGQHELAYTLQGVCTVVALDTFELIPFLPVVANDMPEQLCTLVDSVWLYTNQPGLWTGPGFISDSGWFSPILLDTGWSIVNFNPSSPCVNDTTFAIQLTSSAEVTLNLPESVCVTDDIVELSAFPGSGSWYGPGVVNNTNSFNPAMAGVSVTMVEYYLGDICSTMVSQNIIVVDTVSLVLSSLAQTLCPGDLELLSANLDNVNYLSSNLEYIGGNVYFQTSGLAPGDYIVEAEYTGVCESTDEISIHVFDTLLNISSVGPVCIDAGEIELVSNTNSGNWYGSGVIEGVFHPNGAGVGTHVIRLTVDSICTFSDSIFIEVQDYQEVVHSLPTEWCDNAGAIALQITPAGGNWWVSVPHDGSIHPETLAGQTIEIQYDKDTVCDVDFAWEITINSSPNLVISNDTMICPGTAAALWAAGADLYSWFPSMLFVDPLIADPITYPTESTEYQVVGVNAANCSDTANIRVDLYPQPAVEIHAVDSACFGDVVQLNGTGGISYVWTGDGISEYNISNPIIFSDVTQEIFLSGIDNNGCEDNDSIEIHIIEPIASITPETISGVSPLEITFMNQSDAETFYWNFGNGQEYFSENINDSPTIIFEGESNYMVMLVATSAFCKDTVYAEVEVIYDSKILMFPNIVTNNGDGKNDYFKLLTQNISELDLVIMNRWGDYIGSIKTPDGHWSAKESNDGTYFYSYTAMGMDGRTFSGSGYFTVTSEH